MGLDVVELVLECESSFNIDLEDSKLGQMRTVGDLFELIYEQLHLPFGRDGSPPKNDADLPLVTSSAGGWTRDTVWERLVTVCEDQLEVSRDQITYAARFLEDLGAD
ncbi:MAG TPA: hypothetical protein VL986_08110 [Terracidiphilus sp.]|nr:hypothetical protein [Terracidiphilus sp.]